MAGELSNGQDMRLHEEHSRRPHGNDHAVNQPSQQERLDTTLDTNQQWRSEQWDQGGLSPDGMVDNVRRGQLERSAVGSVDLITDPSKFVESASGDCSS